MKILNYFALPRRIEIGFSKAEEICRRVEIRVAPIPSANAARCPQFLSAGFVFGESPEILRVLEAPSPLPRAARKVLEPIDFRIFGGEDMRMEE